MKGETVAATSSGCSILTVLQVVLIVLKLLKIEPVASWAWTTVLIPLWISLACLGACILLFIAIAIILAITKDK